MEILRLVDWPGGKKNERHICMGNWFWHQARDGRVTEMVLLISFCLIASIAMRYAFPFNGRVFIRVVSKDTDQKRVSKVFTGQSDSMM